MKIKFNEQELEVLRVHDSAEKRESSFRQVNVTLEKCTKTTDELYNLLDTAYQGSFVLVREDLTEETFEDFENYTVTRNIEKTTEQTTISFSK